MRKTQKSQSSENEFGKLALVSIRLPVSFASSYRGYAKTKVVCSPTYKERLYSTDVLTVKDCEAVGWQFDITANQSSPSAFMFLPRLRRYICV
jgi:hypothetical protein